MIGSAPHTDGTNGDGGLQAVTGTTIEVAGEVVDDFPDLQVHLLVVTGLRNAEEWPMATAQLEALESEAGDGLWPALAEDEPRLASWQRAYRAFGTNPRRQRPSVDALRRRLARTGRLPRINGAVDAYNVVSARHGLPAGAFDLATLGPHVALRRAVDGDVFVPMGAPEESERPPAGEVVYGEPGRVLTRHWNHRDAHATRVDLGTTDAVFLVERADDSVPHDAVRTALDDLDGLTTAYGGTSTRHVLDARRRVATIGSGPAPAAAGA